MKHYIFLVSILLVTAFSCEKTTVDVLKDGENLDVVAFDLTRTTPDALYRELSANYEEKNFVHSPLSIQLALYMAFNGAEGTTKDEIRNLLGEEGNTDIDINDKMEAIQDYFNDLLEKGTIDISNAAFYDKNRINLDMEYSAILDEYYDASVEKLDFNSKEAVDVINDWASENTNGKIPKVLETISQEEILFLLNAIYLKADWDSPFIEEATRTDKFFPFDGKESEVEYMFRDGGFQYLDNEEESVVRMPLSDTSLYAWFVMPKNGSLTDWNRTFTYEDLNEYSDTLQSGRLMLFLPKFQSKMHQNLNSILREMGMPSAFDPQRADFSNLGTVESGENIYLSRVVHDAFVQVDEKGVEGAAVTTVGFGVTSMPPVIKFNQPFAYFIVDAKTDIPLFAGHFYNIEVEDEL